MYGPVAGPMTEDLPYRATTRKGAMRARMAEAVLAAHHAGRLPTTSGRGSDFFGPGVLDSALGERVFASALAGKTAQGIGDLDQPHTFTFINDFGEALAILGEHEAALGRAWHVPNAAPLTQRRVIALIFETLGAPPRMSGMGRLMMMLGGLFIVGAREMVEMMYEFEQPFVVDSGAFTRAFGQQATPLPEAIRQTVAWYRAHQGQPQPTPAVTGR